MISPHRTMEDWAPRRAVVAGALLLLGAGLVCSRSGHPAAQQISVGRWPAALVLVGAHAFVANDGDGTLSVLDLVHERLMHTVVIGRSATLAPLALALAPQTQRLFVAERKDDGTPSLVQVLDSRSGTLLRTVRVGQSASALAMDTRLGHVFVANMGDGSVSMLDAHTGGLLHTSAVGLYPMALAVDAHTARAFVIGWGGTPPESMQSRGAVSLLDTHSGAFLRAVAVGHAPAALAISSTTGRAFVANLDDDSVSVLDARSGRVLGTVTVGPAPCALAVDARHGQVYVLNAGDGTLSVLDAATGTPQGTITVDHDAHTDLRVGLASALAVDEARERVYVSTPGPLDRAGVPLGHGLLHVVDTRSGARQQTIAVGVNPHALAVDASTGRIIVTNGGGVVRHAATWAEQAIHWARQRLPGLGRFAPSRPSTDRVRGSVSLITPGA